MMPVPAPAPAATGHAGTCSALLAETYRHLARACEPLHLAVADGPSGPVEGWTDAARLAARPELIAAFIDAEAARIATAYGHRARGDVAASRALHGYLWSVGLLMSGPWYLTRRVPRVRPRDVRIDQANGAFAIVPGGGFACLPDDPAARLTGARVVTHEEALRAELRAAVADHVQPLLSAMAPHLRRGPRALWGMVADDLVSGIWYLGRVLGQEGRSVRAASALLPGGNPPFPGGAAFRLLAAGDGRSYPTRTRTGCCLYYTIRPSEACLTCPRTDDDERLRRLRQR